MHASTQSTLETVAAEPTTGEPTLSHRVHTALSGNPHLSGRQLRIETHAGRVVLHGVVSTYYQKQMAQEALRRLDGVETIENQLQVAWR